LEKSFTAHMPLLMASSTFKLGRRGEVLLSGVTCIVFIVNICCIFGNTENGLNSLRPVERPDESKVCGTWKNSRRQDRVAEIVKSWRSYTYFSAEYL